MNALVTGGGGFLGRYIVEQLLERGDCVRVFNRNRYPELDAMGVESHCGDLKDAEAVAAACEGVDAVFHVAAKAGYWGRWKDYHESNVIGTQNVIAAAQRHGIGKLIYTSTPSVVYDGRDQENIDESHPYPQKFLTHYAHTKALAEQAVLAANGQGGLCTVSLRPHIVWGPRDNHLIPRIIERARRGLLRRVGDGTNKVDVTYVENAAHAHLLAADRLAPGSPVAGQIYFISQGQPVVLWDFINTILEGVGVTPVTQTLSAPVARCIGAISECLYKLIPAGEPRMTRYLAKMLSTSHYYNITQARRELGYAPKVSGEEGLEKLFRYYRKT